MKRLSISVIAALLLGGLSQRAAADPPTDEEQVIGAPSRGCTSRYATDAQWSLKGEVEVGEVLRALAQLTCERFLVTRTMMRTKVTVAIKGDKMTSRELRERVLGTLRANGIAVEHEMLYRVVSGAESTPSGYSPPYFPPPPPPPSPPAISSEELDKGIRCENNKCEIKQAIIDKMFADTSGMSRSARIVPSIKEGKPNGFKLYAIRPSSYIGRLGFANGDTLVSINGMELASPERALEVYSKLRNAKHVTIDVERRGVPMVLEYTVK